MNRSFIIPAMAAIACLAFVSCDKESLTKSDNGASKDGVRTITVSFTATRSELNGLQPSFKAGDEIILRDQSGTTDTKSVTVSNGVATVSTSLTGELTAVYPASASTDGKTFTVSSSQDGTFAKANICTATIPDGSNPKAEIVNQTAILKFSVPAKKDAKGVDYSPKTIKVKSRGSNSIASGDSKEITITASEGGIITPSDGGFYYMAVLPGETISNLTVCSGEGMRCPTASGTLSANTIYDVALPVLNGHEYVELTISGKTYKWATMNVGATSPTDYGLYFAWGETTGHAATTKGKNAFTFGTGSAGFDSSNYPYATTTDPKFSTYVPSEQTDYLAEGFGGDTKTVLESSDDAATANWGSTWRMPTNEEFGGLVALSTKSWNVTTKGYNFTDAQGNSIFLPAAGYGGGTDLLQAGGCGSYSSLSLYASENPYFVYFLNFSNGSVKKDFDCRCIGRSVRPLSE